MTSILWPNCYIGRVSPLFIPQIGVILLPFFALTMWGLSTSLSIWSSKSDPHHHGCPCYTPRAEGQFILHMTFSFSYVCLSFLKLRWPDETSSRHMSFWPWLLFHDCIFPTRYLLYPPVPLALAFEVCLAGLMLIVSAPVDFVFGLTLIAATPRVTGLPLAD